MAKVGTINKKLRFKEIRELPHVRQVASGWGISDSKTIALNPLILERQRGSSRRNRLVMPDWRLLCMGTKSFRSWEGVRFQEQVGEWESDGKLACRRMRGLSSSNTLNIADEPQGSWGTVKREQTGIKSSRTLKPTPSLLPRASCLCLMTHSPGQGQLLASGH